MSSEPIYTHTYHLTAGECNAEGLMPITLIASRAIEVATEHANALGIGYATLITKGMGWVLSRVSIEMTRFPGINEEYTFATWIESYNRYFSERNFRISGRNGETLGYIRSVWAAMSYETRTLADLNTIGEEAFPTADVPCPIDKTLRPGIIPEDCRVEEYTFRYCDLDFNRHVNTVRYIELVLDYWPLEHFEKVQPFRFDILFHQECHYGETVKVRIAPEDESLRQNWEIRSADDKRAVSGIMGWKDL